MADEIRQDISSPLLTDLLKTRSQYTADLTDLNKRLSEAKVGKRGGIKSAIRNVEQQIKQIDKSIDKERNDLLRQEKIHNQEILANQGIDSRSNMLQGIGGIVQSGANLAGSLMGAGGLGAIGVQKQITKGTVAQADASVKIQESKTSGMLGMSKNATYAVIGVVVVLALLMFKKK